MSKHLAYSYVEIDDADMERTPSVGHREEMIELIEQYRSNSARAHTRWRGVLPAF
jgi:hypothetical protein